ncbi:MAG: hypothetical protein ACOYMB_01990 [Patescibacteria group bacterium]
MKKILTFFLVLFLLVSAIDAKESCSKSTNKAGLNTAYDEVRVVRTIQNILLPSQAEIFVGYISRIGQHNDFYNSKPFSSEINEVKAAPVKSGKPP